MADPNWSNVAVLLHLDGTDGSSSIVDEAGHTITNTSVTLTTADFVFGTASGSFNGTNRLAFTAVGTEFQYGTGGGTIEGWFFPTVTGTASFIWGQGVNLSNGIVLGVSTSHIVFRSNRTSDLIATVTIADFAHVAWVWNSSGRRIYLNGVQVASDAVVPDVTTDAAPSLGNAGMSVSYCFAGKVDEFRVTKGVERYTSGFTVPSMAFDTYQTLEYVTESLALTSVLPIVDLVELAGGFVTADAAARHYKAVPAVTAGIAFDVAVVSWQINLLREQVTLQTSFTTNIVAGQVVANAVRLVTTITGALHFMLTDTASVSDSVVGQYHCQMAEVFRLSNVLASQLIGANQLSEVLTLRDALSGALTVFLDDGLTLSDELLGLYHKFVTEILDVSSTALSRLVASGSLADTLQLDGFLVRFLAATALDTLTITGESSGLFGSGAAIVESLGLSASATGLAHFFAVSTSTAALSSHASFGQILDAVIAETIAFAGGMQLVDSDGVAWVITPESKAAAQFKNYAFNSFAKVGQKYYGANNAGVCELTGNTDAGAEIAASLRTGLTHFGVTQQKHIPRAYLGYTSSGQLVLKCFTTDGGAVHERWYELVLPPQAHAPREARVKLARGVVSRYWQFEVHNVAGDDFELDDLRVLPVILTRRV